MAKWRLSFLFLFCFLSLCRGFSEDSPTARKFLVLLDQDGYRSTYSIFWSELEGRGHDLDFRLADDSGLTLKHFGEYFYDALIIFAPGVDGFGGKLDVASILEFVDSGHDLILAAGPNPSETIKDIANECGLDFDEGEGALAIDHLHFVESPSALDHTLIAADHLINSTALLGPTNIKAPVLYRGAAMSISPSNELVVSVLTGFPTTFSHVPTSPLTKVPALLGESVVLVAAMQARNNARVLVSGSLELFSDEFFTAPVKKHGSDTEFPRSGNQQCAVELARWTFHERGHLKAGDIRHHRVGETEEPAVYRVKDELELEVEILEWDGERWAPFQANDVQVEFFMMGAYVRKSLQHNGKGLFQTSFQVPDVYGVFQFKVDYHRLGYTFLNLRKQIPVRPYRHNEFERFIVAAYPYYTSVFSMLAGFVVFSTVFLYNKA